MSLFPTSRWTLLLIAFALTVSACDDNPVDSDPDPVQATLVENLPADPHTSTDPMGRPIGTGNYTLFSLRTGQVVANTDSATTNWDIAFNGTTILTNGGSSGPGEGGAVTMAAPFEEVLVAPADGAFFVDEAGSPAVAQGDNGGWYNYNPQTHVVTPVPGRTLVVRTADGRYGKVRILSYYRDMPETIDENSESRYYTFDYVFQPDGSRSLEATTD